ncbi:MAG: cysteine desulfurase-like protein [Deltaproteobacteria bacterium]|nr:MAG: cysteine desulfurase-like protein [Deltaproteobacteria bacterium]
MTALDVAAVRRLFPALARTQDGRPVVFADGPAGSQVPQPVIDAVAGALRDGVSNTHGAFAASRALDRRLEDARAAVADLLGAPDPACCVFGPNMTTLTFALSRALMDRWEEGDEIVVTRMDHDANVWPWVLAARDAGARVRHVGFRAPECTLDLDELRAVLGERTRLVAVAAASNAVGTIHPVADVCALAHDAGAEVFVDAVHYAPHRLIDVQAWDCDYLACSAYKFFAPHVGILWGKRESLRSLPAYQVRPAGDELPGRWETGTQNHEGIAGVAAAIDYLASLGDGPDRRARLRSAFAAIAAHESVLAARLHDGLAAIAGVTVYGPRQDRAPTFGFTCRDRDAASVAEHLASRAIYAWHGNFYAVELTRALGLEPGGLVRVGLLHYNTADEVDRIVAAVRELAA